MIQDTATVTMERQQELVQDILKKVLFPMTMSDLA